MTASWQVSAVVALDERRAPHPRALALHLSGGLVYVGADHDLLTVGARLQGGRPTKRCASWAGG